MPNAKRRSSGTAGRARRKKRAEPASRGVTPAEVFAGSPTASAAALSRAIVADGGSVLSVYRDPLGGHWQILAALPIDRVEPTPFQRDLSETHVKHLTDVIGKMDRFLDPITAVRAGDGRYWTPNGHHRLAAMRALGSKAITALVLPETEAAYRILALNVEKAHNLREKSLEVIRMARALAPTERRSEADLALEFEEAAFLTLGICYEKQGRFSGGAYHPVLRRVDEFLSRPIAAALTIREERAARVLSLDELVAQAVRGLKERGFVSPYLKAYVVARVNPLRFQKTASAPSFDSTLDRMLAAARRFDPSKIRVDQLAASSAWTGEGDAS